MSDDRKDLPPASSPQFLERVRETLGVYLGNRGNALDRGVTLRDLTDAGLVTLRAGFGGSGGTRAPIAGPGTALAGDYELDLTPPPTPDGFVLSAAISNLFIGHNAALYSQGHGHGRTVVYGATWVSGPLPTFANAVKITEFTGTVFAHPTNPATTWHVWIKWQSMDGVLSVVPAGGTNGLITTTGQDVSKLLAALTGQITSSQLYSTLGARIDLVDGAAGLPGSVAQRLVAEATARAAAIAVEVADRATAVQAETTARSNGDTAEITARQTLATKMTGLADPSASTLANITSGLLFDERTARSTADSSEVTARQLLSATLVGTNDPTGKTLANVTSGILFDERVARVSATDALVTRATALETSVNNGTTGLSSKASVTQVATAKSEAIAASAVVTDTLAASIATRPNLCPDVDKWALPSGFTLANNGWGPAATADVMTGTNAALSPRFPTQVGATYVITGDSLRIGGTGGVYFDMQFYDAQGATVLDGLGSVVSTAHDFQSTDSTRILHSVSSVAPPNAVTMCARFVYDSLASVTALGFRQVKVERGSLPATPYTLEGSVSGLTAAVQTETSVRATQTGELYAQNTVKIDLAGLVSGYGLASTASTAAPTSAFGVRANAFFVAPPSVAQTTAPTVNLYDGYVWLDTSVAPNVTRYRSGASWVLNSPVLPFVVQATPTTVNGVAVPAGVYASDLYVKNGTITNLKVANGAIDDLKVASVSAAKLTAGSIAVGQYIQSTNYVANTSGWRIHGDGTGEFGAAYIRGLLTAAQIDTRGLTIRAPDNSIILNSGASLQSQINPYQSGATVGANSTNLTVGVGGNMIPNSDLSSGADKWVVGWSQGGTGYNPPGWDYAGVDWTPVGGHQVGASRSGTTPSTTGVYDITYSEFITVVPGKRYEFSAYMAAHRCTASMGIVGYNTALDTQVSWGSSTVSAASGGKLLSGWTRVTGFYTATTDTACVRVYLRGSIATAADPYHWGTRLFMAEAGPNQTEFSPWSDGGRTGKFAELSQITQGNASTYIASAAIGSAQIGSLDANVITARTITTDKLVVNSVTQAASTLVGYNTLYSGAAITLLSGSRVYGAAITTTGGNVLVTFDGALILSINTGDPRIVTGTCAISIYNLNNGTYFGESSGNVFAIPVYGSCSQNLSGSVMFTSVPAGAYRASMRITVGCRDLQGNGASSITGVTHMASSGIMEFKV